MPSCSLSRLKTKTALERGWNALKSVAPQVVDFFTAPWVKSKCVKPEHSNWREGVFTGINWEMDFADAYGVGPKGEVHVFVDNIVLQTERYIDLQALARILAAATEAKKKLASMETKIYHP